MAYRYDALYQEIRLRDEVLYLHGLYNNQAPPPSSTSNVNPNPRPIVSLRPRAPVNLKRYQNRPRRRKKKIVSDKEWPCDPTSEPGAAEATTGWPVPPPRPVPPPPSAADLAKAAAAAAQKNAVAACKRFFSKNELDRDSVDGEESAEEEEEEGVEECAFNFFLEVITKDPALRRYCDENKEKGEFLCLVCEGCGVKKWRKYGDLGALVQHCHGVAKLGRKAAHRGLAKAVCRVAGWKFDRLPTLILDFEHTSNQQVL
ncbi:hypothetical protein AXF42_Ash001309 [Apostasia shenzhenica]|uniref:Uncharacterized protein n=1 Tax=Apostasia shenzhenica TaxID=1088818 RepID=A0A2I0AUN7_9ASPA|nr:hypothetical protein AXF42_Ash001309 [Apostasia shenzhenica]